MARGTRLVRIRRLRDIISDISAGVARLGAAFGSGAPEDDGVSALSGS